MSVFDHYYKRYDAWYDKNKYVYLSELEALKKSLPKFGRGLEIGVGTGRFACVLGIAVGIDPSAKMIEAAIQRGANARRGFGENLSFGEEAFDYVAIIATLCFVRNPLKVLQEAQRVLKKNGKIIIGIIDKESFLGSFYQRKKSVFYKKANFFSVKEVAKLLIDSKFKQINYRQTLFGPLDKINLIQKPRRGFGEGGFVVISGKKI